MTAVPTHRRTGREQLAKDGVGWNHAGWKDKPAVRPHPPAAPRPSRPCTETAFGAAQFVEHIA